MRPHMIAVVVVGILAIAFFSWVGIADGPDAPAVRFYPDKTEIRPGETIVWTIEVIDESILPFTVRPESNNDMYREPTIRVDTASIQIEYTYETANIYMPYIEADNYRGYRAKVYSDHLVSVIPDLQNRQGVGLSLPLLDNPVGDYIKGMNVFTFDYTLFDTAAGERFIQEELDRIAALGCNMVVFNVAWFNDTESSSLQEPIYGNAWPACWVGTLPVDALVALVDWCHLRDMRVCFRYFLRQNGDHGSTARAYYSPADPELYIEQQTAIKVEYARLCETLGVELFCLDSENQYFTRASGVSSLIQEVRAVYDGAITNGAWDALANYSCPYASELDVLAWSDYYFAADTTMSAEQLRDLYLYHYVSDILPVLQHFGKPGLVIETGADLRNSDTSVVEQFYTAYLDAFARLQQSSAPLMGNVWWVWNLSDPPVEPGVMRGHSAEGILSHYFHDVISDEYTLLWPSVVMHAPSRDFVVEDFESGAPSLQLWNKDSTIETTIVNDSSQGRYGLRIDLTPSGTADFRYGFTWGEFAQPVDLGGYQSFNFQVKAAIPNWGIEVNLVDSDGDRFNISVDTQTLLEEGRSETAIWQSVSIPVSLFTKPTWASEGNGTLDLRRIKRWGLGFFYGEQGAQTFWIDDIYMSREGSLEELLRVTQDDGATTGSVDARPDSDGDGVPDDEDYCPNWPGDPDMNGC